MMMVMVMVMVMMMMMMVMMLMTVMMMNVSVARWERGLQGFDDDPHRWIHPLLPYAHRTQC